ncbi:hypothetical protein [Prosthecobacter sp.]|jgi:hypothetical protein|uniref:hypothetical protein n=1 Tax=Prosthecobacter sp. TaxID=1965333 RepID=UPI003784A656
MNAKQTRKGRKDSGKVWRLVPRDALIVTVWDGPVDPEALNAELLRLMRGDDARQNLTEAELARRSGITRQHVHNLHHENMVLTVPLTTKWSNGRDVNVVFLLGYAADRVRRRQPRTK